MIPNDKPLSVNSTAQLSIALRYAAGVSVVQIAAFYVVTSDARAVPVMVLVLGWLAIFGGTTFQLWRSGPAFLGSELGLVRFLVWFFAGSFGLAMLYATVMESYLPDAGNLTWRVKAAFTSNIFAALAVAALTAVVSFIVQSVRDIKARR